MRLQAGVAVLALSLVAGCAAPPPQPFQAMAATNGLAYGYQQTKLDAIHYSVTYSADHQQTAQNYLELRAAQIARDAGFSWFVFQSRSMNVKRAVQSDLVPVQETRGNPNNSLTSGLVPDSVATSKTSYYYASGQLVLLTPDQAKANPGALEVSAVLARPAGKP